MKAEINSIGATDQWREDLPPHAGWFIASTDRDAAFRRYWGGHAWSAPVHVEDPAAHWARALATAGESQSPAVEWRPIVS